jgi:hypothetical protein
MTGSQPFADQRDGADAEVGDLLADLVSLRENEPVLASLFTRAQGDWISLRGLCSGLPGIDTALNRIGRSTELMAAWLNDPLASSRSGYCLVALYSEENMRCEVAVYNRARLEADMALS